MFQKWSGASLSRHVEWAVGGRLGSTLVQAGSELIGHLPSRLGPGKTYAEALQILHIAARNDMFLILSTHRVILSVRDWICAP